MRSFFDRLRRLFMREPPPIAWDVGERNIDTAYTFTVERDGSIRLAIVEEVRRRIASRFYDPWDQSGEHIGDH